MYSMHDLFVNMCISLLHTLVQWNVIMYANVTLPSTLVSNKLIVPFSPRYFNGIKIVTAFKYIFEETMPKLSVNFENHVSQDSHKNQYPGPVCNFGFTAPQYSDKYWSNLPLKCHIVLIGNTHKIYCITCAIIWFTLWLVCLEPVGVDLMKWCHHCTSV